MTVGRIQFLSSCWLKCLGFSFTVGQMPPLNSLPHTRLHKTAHNKQLASSEQAHRVEPNKTENTDLPLNPQSDILHSFDYSEYWKPLDPTHIKKGGIIPVVNRRRVGNFPGGTVDRNLPANSQGTQIWFQVQEDPTCHTKQLSQWAQPLRPGATLSTKAQAPRDCALQQEEPSISSPCTAMGSLHSPD